MAQLSKHLKITGRVQGVGFRYFARKNAEKLNIRGWVKNMQDGSVEVYISGNEDDVKEMETRLWDGPRPAIVEEIAELGTDGQESSYSGFTVRR